MKGMSENPIAEIETHVHTLCWRARVSSFSNIADAPSRGACDTLKKLGFTDVSMDALKTLSGICVSVGMKVGKTAESQFPPCQKKCVPAA